MSGFFPPGALFFYSGLELALPGLALLGEGGSDGLGGGEPGAEGGEGFVERGDLALKVADFGMCGFKVALEGFRFRALRYSK